MKSILFYLGIFSFALAAAQPAEPLSIDDCYRLARENYPLIKKRDLIAQTKDYSIKNISTVFLPQFTVNGQATYQSAVTTIKVPNVDIPILSNEQYRLNAEVNQVIFEGGTNNLQKKSIEANSAIEEQQLEVELYKLNERINQLFFGILLAKEQQVQTGMLKKDIQLGLDKVKAAIANGTALKSSGDALEAELLKADQRAIELQSLLQAYTSMLSYFINKPLNEYSVLVRPASLVAAQQINRPELILYEKEKISMDIEDQLVKAKNVPRVGLFLQGGMGRPGLDMLKNEFDTYYIGGVKLNWSLSGLYTAKKERILLDIKRKSVDLQEETFLFNTGLTLKKQNAEITKLQNLVNSDNEIITLRTRIKNTSLSQLEYGVINSSDYLQELNAEDLAKQSRLLHETQLLLAQYDHQITTGK